MTYDEAINVIKRSSEYWGITDIEMEALGKAIYALTVVKEMGL